MDNGAVDSSGCVFHPHLFLDRIQEAEKVTVWRRRPAKFPKQKSLARIRILALFCLAILVADCSSWEEDDDDDDDSKSWTTTTSGCFKSSALLALLVAILSEKQDALLHSREVVIIIWDIYFEQQFMGIGKQRVSAFCTDCWSWFAFHGRTEKTFVHSFVLGSQWPHHLGRIKVAYNLGGTCDRNGK